MGSSSHPSALGLAALAGALAAGAACAQPGGPQSTATGADARFQSRGVASELGPIATVSGQPSGKYEASTTVADISQNVAIAPVSPTPTAYVISRNLTSHVAGSGWGVDSRSSEGDTSIEAAQLWMNLDPPPPGGPVPEPPLTVTARSLSSSASFSTVVPNYNFAIGVATIGSLTVTGAFLGGATLKYSGSAPPDTVIYSSPTVTITLNRQIKSGIISCSPGCAFTVTSIDVAAVDIALDKVTMYGTRISGDIVLGEAAAQ